MAIIREIGGFGSGDIESMGLSMTVRDMGGVHMVGDTVDRIFKDGILVDEIHGHNLVVSSFLNLVMSLMKGQSGYSGITYWAVGSGSDSWDTSPIDPVVSATKLTQEIGRVAIPSDEIVFLNSSYEESQNPTNILQIKHTFGINDCNGIWREFGLFGGTATSALNSGVMINKRHHGVITKTSELTIERTMRFTLTLV